jgi:uncharacterized repeat protein (TIGR01451 family)
VNELGYADVNLYNNTAAASTTVQAPRLTLSKSATTSVNAGEAITYTITYQNTGSGAAADVVVTDTLPAGVYYSTALDTGSGPKPNTVTVNGDGTRTLTWLAGGLAGQFGTQTIRLLATYFNLATRRINAATVIKSRTASLHGLDNVAEAALYTIDTLALPFDAVNHDRYDDATRVLDEINTNRSETY